MKVRTISSGARNRLRNWSTTTVSRGHRVPSQGLDDAKLAELVMALREDDRLCLILEEEHSGEPQIICSLGLA